MQGFVFDEVDQGGAGFHDVFHLKEGREGGKEGRGGRKKGEGGKREGGGGGRRVKGWKVGG